jgi:hypothetical protein
MIHSLRINPATEEVIGKVAKGNEKDVEKAVQAAHDVYLESVAGLITSIVSLLSLSIHSPLIYC